MAGVKSHHVLETLVILVALASIWPVMLGWAHPDIREKAWAESYFAPDELQRGSERYKLLFDVLQIYDPSFAELFDAAWQSSALEECPSLKDWYDVMDVLPREPVAEWVDIDPRILAAETPVPDSVAVPVAPPAPVQDRSRRRSRQRAPRQRASRRGCRLIAIILGVLGILSCYAIGLAVEWSFIQNIF